MKKLCIILNASAGSLVGKALNETAELVRSGFTAAGVEADIRTPEGAKLVETLEQAAGEKFDAVIVGGGDGTVATAAAIMAKHDRPLGVLPLGTMNMLARDLGMPLTLPEAVAALASGEVRRIDIADVNGEIFLCNATFGLVPMIGKEREAQRGKSILPTILAMGGKIYSTVRRWPGVHLILEHDGKKRHVYTRLLTVANNAYEDGGSGFLTRESLDSGQLNLYLSRHQSRLGFMWFSIGLMLRFWQHNPRLQTIVTEQVIIRGRKRSLVICADGENKRLPVPLVFRIRPGALPVLAPKAKA